KFGSVRGQDVEPDEVVRQLESRASRGGDELGTSLRRLAKMGAWEAVDRWLKKVDSIDDQKELARIASLIGADMILRTSLQESLTESGRSAINKLTTASKAERESPALMQRAIELITKDGIEQKLPAARILRRGGSAGIQAIVDRIAKGTTASQQVNLLRVLDEFGDAGEQCLNQLALYGDETARVNCLRVLANREDALPTLVSAAFASDASERERSLAQATVRQKHPDFDAPEAVLFLTDYLNRTLRLAEQTPNTEAPAMIWSIGADRTSVSPSRSYEIFLKYRDAYDAARRLSRQDGVPSSSLQLAMIADLNYRVIADVDWGTDEQINGILDVYGAAASAPSLSQALGQAIQKRHIPAALGLIRILDLLGNESPNLMMAILASENGTASPLATAASDASPRIRFEAARSLSTISGQYAGSSNVRKTLAEMARLPDRPTAILIETRPFIALAQESILSQLGFEVETVQSVNAAERVIGKGGDLELVVSKLRLADAGATELVDRLRRSPRSSGVAIVFYDDGDASERTVRSATLETTSRRWDREHFPTVRVVPLPGDPTAFGAVLRELDVRRRLPSLTIADRRSFRNAGIVALAE
ncbi:MAG: hypothetical protein AAFX06_05470, partial [Planctomycetota bacterium]